MLSLLGLVSVDGELTVTNNSNLAGFNSNNPNAPAFVGLLSTGAITIVNNAQLKAATAQHLAHCLQGRSGGCLGLWGAGHGRCRGPALSGHR